MTTLKCRHCGNNAVINMRHSKLALCESHYIEWFHRQTEKVIKKYNMISHSDRILLAVSGGKDSLSLWYILTELGYKVDGLYINLGITEDDYSLKSQSCIEEFVNKWELNLIVYNIQNEIGYSLIDISQSTKRGAGRPCSVCGLIKRHVMNQISDEQNFNVLATGHNLDDEVATLFSNTLTWSIPMISNQSPVLEATDGFVRKVKPLFRFYERETTAYAIIQNIQYIYEECPFSKGSKSIQYKHIMNDLESKQPGTKINYFTSFQNAQKKGVFQNNDQISDRYKNKCKSCGQPTTAPDLCAYCRMIESLK